MKLKLSGPDGPGLLRPLHFFSRHLLHMLAVLLCLAVTAFRPAAAATYTYTKTITIPVPPASSFTGNSGGDGWAVALTPDAVYNVYHHDGRLDVACHKQTDASNCWSSAYKTISDPVTGGFYVPNHPGLALNQRTGHLFVYVTRISDSTRGVACFDTTQPDTSSNPYCGFTPLSSIGDGGGRTLSPGNGQVFGSQFLAFNFVDGQSVGATANKLMCFDIDTETACPSQPYDLGLGGSTVQSNGYSPAGAVGTRVLVPVNTNGGSLLGCYDTASKAVCVGTWPLPLPISYTFNGAPYPMLNANGGATGVCLPAGGNYCYGLDGTAVTPPAGLVAAMGSGTGYNGPAQVIAARVYVPSGSDNTVRCYDFSTLSQCANFPHPLPNSNYTYTINKDPQRPQCLWTNSDNGSAQIQNFDAFSGGGCGQGAVRVLASSFVAPDLICTPLSYTKLEVLDPTRSGYGSGSVAFRDGSGNPINGIPDAAIDNTGSVSLVGLALNANGLPQFLITLNAPTSPVGAVTVRMTWTGENLLQCGGTGVIETKLIANPSVLSINPNQVYLKLSATLQDSTGTGLPGRPVGFTIGKRLVCTALTDGAGLAYCPRARVFESALTVLTRGYDAKFDGNDIYLPSSAHGRVFSVGTPASTP